MDKIHWSFSYCLRLDKDGVRLFYFDRKKASLHVEGPSHECGRETRYRVGGRLDKASPDMGVIWLAANGWLG